MWRLCLLCRVRSTHKLSGMTDPQTETAETVSSAESESVPMVQLNRKQGATKSAPVFGGDHGLTDKQEAFAQAVASGESYAEAYRLAYDVGKNTKITTVYTRSYEVGANSRVAERINELVAFRLRHGQHSPEMLRQFGIDVLFQVARTGNSDASRVSAAKALVTIGETALAQKSGALDDKTSEQLKREIVQRLRKMLGKQVPDLLDITPSKA